MSYTNYRTQRNLTGFAASGVALTAGDKAFLSAGHTPLFVHGLAAVVTTAIQAADPATIALEKRPTAGSDTNRVAASVPTIVIPGGTAVGKVVYANVKTHPLIFPYKIFPGEELVAEVTDATAAGAAAIWVDIEFSPAHPGNEPDMIASA